ncbi:MAG: hypothetical protein IIT46_12500 [Lachnospiraceae bacterium]|nr:hypothetical protein [Lachnospiraceae bacterium]
MQMKLNIKRCFYELWKKRHIIGLIVAMSVLVGLYTMLNAKEVGNYNASASVYHSTTYGNYEAEGGNSGGGTASNPDDLTEFSEIAYSRNVAKRAAALLDIEGINETNIGQLYSANANGNFLYVNGFSDDPKLATGVANAVAEAFAVEYKNLTGDENLQVFEKAENATYYAQDDTNKKMTMIIFTGVGFVLACMVMVLRVIFSAKVQDFAECDLDGEIEILGVIPEVKE